MVNKAAREKLISYTLAALAILIPYFILVPNYFPYTGFAITFAALSTIVFSLHKQKTAYIIALFAAALASSFFLILRANMFLALLNSLAVIYINSVSIQISRNQPLSIITIVLAPVAIFFSSLRIQHPQFRIALPKIQHKEITRLISEPGRLLYSLAITLVLLIVIVPLLSSANPLFADLTERILEYFNLPKQLQRFFSSLGPLHVVRIIVAAILFILLPRFATYTTSRAESKRRTVSLLTNLPLLLPKISIAIVLTIFFYTHTQLYTSTAETLQEMGYTQSQYAREVFAQLSVVALVIFALVYNDRNQKPVSRTMTYILLIQALFLVVMAYKSDYDYSSLWGFTHKRLYGFAVVAWSTGVILLFFSAYIKNNTRIFLKHGIMYTLLVLLGINIANFDYLIYHARKASYEWGPDYYYMASYLSADSDSYHEQQDELTRLIQPLTTKNEDEHSRLNNYLASFNALSNNIVYIQNKYRQRVDLRTFNYAEYTAYEKIKHVSPADMQASREKIQKLLDMPLEEFYQVTPTRLY